MRLTPAVKTIIIINLVFYALTYWITPMFPLNGSTTWFHQFNSLSPIGEDSWHITQYITYMFMHGNWEIDPVTHALTNADSWMHIFFNMWSLMIFGCAVEQQLGTKRFWQFYILAGIGAALVHQGLSACGIIGNCGLVGASGAIYGVMAAAAYFFPNAQLFIIPIPFPIKLKYLVGGYIVIEMYMGLNSSDKVAHFAHLGGILVGILILLWWKHKASAKGQPQSNGYWTTPNSTSSYNKGESLYSRIKKSILGPKKPKIRVAEEHPADTKADDHAYNAERRRENEAVDAILDKIRKFGYQSLSEDEKAMLFQVSQRK